MVVLGPAAGERVCLVPCATRASAARSPRGERGSAKTAGSGGGGDAFGLVWRKQAGGFFGRVQFLGILRASRSRTTLNSFKILFRGECLVGLRPEKRSARAERAFATRSRGGELRMDGWMEVSAIS